MTQNVGIVIVEYEIKEIDRGVNGERGRTMDTHKFFVEKMRFHLKEQDTLVFVGWFFDGSTKEHSIKAYLDNRELPLTVQVNRGAEVRQKYIRSINEIEEEVVGIIELPPDWRNGRRVTLMAAYREEYKKSYAISTAKLGRLENEVSYYVENCHREGSQITVTGWCMSAGDIKLELLDGSRQPIKQSFLKHRDSLGQQSTSYARSCETEVTWRKKTYRCCRPWDICWALPLVRVRSK